MKNYDEVAASVLRRRDEHDALVKNRIRTVTRIGVPTVSLCLAVLIGIGMWTAENPDKGSNENTDHTERNDIEDVNPENAVVPGDTVNSDDPNFGKDNDGEGKPSDLFESGELDDSPVMSEAESLFEPDEDKSYPETDIVESPNTTVATIPELPETTGPSIYTEQYPDVPDDTTYKPDIGDDQKWEGLDLYARYPELFFSDNSYVPTLKWIDKGYVGRSLDSVAVYGYDYYTDLSHETTVGVYAIDGIDSKYAVAVEFEEYLGEFAVYFSSKELPDTLGKLVESLNLKKNLRFGKVFISGSEYGNRHVHEYVAPNRKIIIDLLLSDYELEDVYNPDIYLDQRIVSISVDFELVGFMNRSISITEGGYLIIDFLDITKIFYIGEERAKTFIEYVLNNCDSVIYEKETEDYTTDDRVAIMTTDDYPITAVTEYDIPEDDVIEETRIPVTPSDEIAWETSTAYDPNK